jgi:transcriptional regulator
MALTEREKEILRLKAEGMSDYRIARKLKIDSQRYPFQKKRSKEDKFCKG